jgi:hypothetical protein
MARMAISIGLGKAGAGAAHGAGQAGDGQVHDGMFLNIGCKHSLFVSLFISILIVSRICFESFPMLLEC